MKILASPLLISTWLMIALGGHHVRAFSQMPSHANSGPGLLLIASMDESRLDILTKRPEHAGSVNTGKGQMKFAWHRTDEPLTWWPAKPSRRLTCSLDG